MSAFTKQLLEVIDPVLARNGFVRWTPKGRNGGGMFYFRRSVTGRRDLFEVQLDKSGRRACFVNLASIDSDRVQTMFEGVIPADEVTTAHLSQRCRLRGNAVFGAFKPSLFERLFTRAELGLRIGRRIVSRFRSADEWFAERKASRHVREFSL